MLEEVILSCYPGLQTTASASTCGDCKSFKANDLDTDSPWGLCLFYEDFIARDSTLDPAGCGQFEQG